MTDASDSARLSAAFVRLADTLADDYDMIELLDTLVRECVELLDIDAGGLMIADPSAQELHLVVSTSDKVGFVGVTPSDGGDGPYIQCYETGEPVSVADIEREADPWPFFREGALAGGFRSMHAFPLKLRGTVIGAMNLFSTSTGYLTDQNATVAKALAAVATIGILQERSINDATVLSDQLQRALKSRILIEQAKGIIAESLKISVDDAFLLLRAHARKHGLRIRYVASKVVDRTLELAV